MLAILAKVGVWLLSGAIARVLVGSGLVFVTAVYLGEHVNNLLALAVSNFGAMGSAGTLLIMGGFGHVITIIGSALLTRAAFEFGGKILGLAAATTA